MANFARTPINLWYTSVIDTIVSIVGVSCIILPSNLMINYGSTYTCTEGGPISQ